MVSRAKIESFRRTVWAHYRAHGRHALPWRATHNPYRILVSEVMLQQTQVERVIPFYQAWMKKFPSVPKLAAATLGDVLRTWQGLGYNRRAKMLHDAAKAVVRERGGAFPATPEELEKLPGVGPYTARAAAAFALNLDVVFVETNIRTAVTHHFFPGASKVDDADVLAILAKALPKGRARAWYSALMDYGAHLKRSGVRLNARATGYTKQKKFQGSAREARGAILKALAQGPRRGSSLTELLGATRRAQLRGELGKLKKEGLVQARRAQFSLPD